MADWLFAPWIDAISDVWMTVECSGFKTMKAPYLFKKAEFPASISPGDDFPIALTLPDLTAPEYSAGGPVEAIITGTTEFHVTADLSMTHMPALMEWPGAIWKAAAANLALGGLVSHFIISKDNGIVGPVSLQYGDESEHWGFIVNWEVKPKNLHTSITVRA